MRKDDKNENDLIVIKKYANRRLYNTDTSTYVTLDDLARMIRSEKDFVVYDAKTGEELTHSVLTQIIMEQESKGQSLLPIPFLRQLIRFYGNSIEQFVPSYLQMSLDRLAKEQKKFHEQFGSTFTGYPLEAMQEHAKKNWMMFEKTMEMFSPYKAPQTDKAPETEQKDENTTTSKELEELKSQMSEMQKKIDKLAK